MDKVVLQATPRTATGRQVRALRRAGQLPAVIYGHNMKPLNISMDAHEASLVLGRLTSSSLISIEVGGKEYPSLVRERQRNHVKGHLIHVDFQAVSLTETIRASVGIVLTGVSPSVKDYNAVLVTGLDSLEVEALPQDLPERVVVDISIIANIGDGVHVRDIVISDKVTILSNADDMIVLATATREEAEEEVTAEAEVLANAAEPEVIEKGKKEEEESEEDK